MSRPEHVAPPEVFYNQTEARKYLVNSRMVHIQTQLAQRCLELLNFPDETPRFLLDIGCGTGLSGDVLSEHGHVWVGLDISPAMLDVAVERDVEGDLFLRDVGDGLFFRTGSFDGAISVSALQWLCNAETSTSQPHKRLFRFFESLYAVLRKGARCALQVYPENAAQMEMITAAAMRAGFSGGLVVDFPNSARAKKYYLVLSAGGGSAGAGAGREAKGRTEGKEEVMGEGEAESEGEGEGKEGAVKVGKRERPRKKRKGKDVRSVRERIIEKKERQRRQGKQVRADSKYTGRKRSKKFG